MTVFLASLTWKTKNHFVSTLGLSVHSLRKSLFKYISRLWKSCMRELWKKFEMQQLILTSLRFCFEKHNYCKNLFNLFSRNLLKLMQVSIFCIYLFTLNPNLIPKVEYQKLEPFADKIGNSGSSRSTNRVGHQTLHEHYKEEELSVIDGGMILSNVTLLFVQVQLEEKLKFWNGDYSTVYHNTKKRKWKLWCAFIIFDEN